MGRRVPRILLVEWYDESRRLIAEVLRAQGYSVVGVRRMNEALRAPVCDVAVVEVLWPKGADASNLVRSLVTRGRVRHVLLFSGASIAETLGLLQRIIDDVEIAIRGDS